jgi:hypothetical protein
LRVFPAEKVSAIMAEDPPCVELFLPFDEEVLGRLLSVRRVLGGHFTGLQLGFLLQPCLWRPRDVSFEVAVGLLRLPVDVALRSPVQLSDSEVLKIALMVSKQWDQWAGWDVADEEGEGDGASEFGDLENLEVYLDSGDDYVSEYAYDY